jgi:methylated-DNA-protein-cysteine methyltransferase-like protein
VNPGSAFKNPLAFKRELLSLVSLIPSGQVATYGQLATLLGSPRHARQVGHVLAGLRYPDGAGDREYIPWHRVINAQGRISAPNDAHRAQIQRSMLEQEGVDFDHTGRCSLKSYLWRPNSDQLLLP